MVRSAQDRSGSPDNQVEGLANTHSLNGKPISAYSIALRIRYRLRELGLRVLSRVESPLWLPGTPMPPPEIRVAGKLEHGVETGPKLGLADWYSNGKHRPVPAQHHHTDNTRKLKAEYQLT